MAYEDLTPAAFKTAKPQFSDVGDAVVQSYIDLGKLFVDQSWPEQAYTPAWIAIVCHLMTLDGLGSSTEGEAYAAGAGVFQTIKSGELTLTKYATAAETGTSYSGWLSSTTCGKFYWTLLRMVKGGPRVAMGLGLSGSPYAKDSAYAWPTFFWGWR